MSEYPIILSLEGNIGAGKSTFLNILSQSQFQNSKRYSIFETTRCFRNQWECGRTSATE